MKRVLLLVAMMGVLVGLGCDAAQTRVWTVRASVVETGLVAHSEWWPAEVETMTPAQIEAFGAARVAMYEKYGQALKDALADLKEE